MSTKRIVAFSSVALALAAVFAFARASAGPDEDAEGVKKSCQAFKAAWNKHDAKGLAGVFTEDATHLDPHGKMDTGRPAIEATLTELMGAKGPFRDSTLVVNKEDVRFPSADVALTDADATVTGAYGPDGAKAPPMDLHVVTVWKKSGDTWSAWACRPYMKPAPPK